MTNPNNFTCIVSLGLPFAISAVLVYIVIRKLSPDFFNSSRVHSLGWALATIVVFVLTEILYKLFLFWYPQLGQCYQ